ncbi:MAG: CRISPR-associated endoribonuclease Cas6 [Chloroflexota bacterium]|nr:CRISPR-associated endoribonuclease Cas6 [Chloroflexota bacterium]
MSNYLYSVVLELRATNAAALPPTMGHLAHALFLDLIGQVDPVLAARLHDEPEYRPFTVSPLGGVVVQGEGIRLQPGQPARLRFTLLDGGALWGCLSTRLLAAEPLVVRLNAAEFVVDRLVSTAEADPSGWAGVTTWQALAATPARRHLTLQFASPTAFSNGNKRFELLPQPKRVWESLVRVWNRYAPPLLALDKAAITTALEAAVLVSDHQINTATLHYPKHTQKGFLGSCTYEVEMSDPQAAALAALAAFARYAGVGYKTTMGMGQVRLDP